MKKCINLVIKDCFDCPYLDDVDYWCVKSEKVYNPDNECIPDWCKLDDVKEYDPNTFKTYNTSNGNCGLCGRNTCNGHCFK